jgi:hypothetical protein
MFPRGRILRSKPSTEGPVPSDYDAELIQPWEPKFAERIFDFLFESPRAAKRFSNILPLVEGAAGRGKTKRIPKEPGRATFAQAMLLVAVLTGFPGSARALVAHPETGCC